jgi:outer membrane receptor for ferrienterochelin and colicin
MNPTRQEKELNRMGDIDNKRILFFWLGAFTLCCFLIHSSVLCKTKTISGQVIDGNSKERLPYANVIIKGTKIGTQTNLEGFFLLHNVPDTLCTLQVTYMGYSPVVVPIDKQTKSSGMLIRMKQTPINIEGVTVSAAQSNFIKSEATPSLITLSPTQISTLPSVGQVDIFRSIQLLPGIAATNDGSSGLYVRGGTPDQNLVLFDGMTVYHVDHFFGFFSAFNPDAIKDVQVYKGAFPAKYGGRLSSVIDMIGKTGNPEEVHGVAGLSLISGNATLEGPLFGGSFFVSARRSYSDIIASGTYNTIYELLTGSDAPQAASGRFGDAISQQETPTSAFLDLNGKYSYTIASKYILSASYYKSTDEYDLTRQSSTQIPSRSNNTQQGNNGGSIKLFAQWGDEFFSNLILAYNGYTSKYTSSMGSQGSNATQFSTDEDNHIDDMNFSADNVWKLTPVHELGFGFQVSQTKVKYSLSGLNPSRTTQNILDFNQRGWLGAAYIQDKWMLLEQFTLTGGLRYNYFSETNSMFLEPRLSSRYELTENISLKAAFGIHYQFVNRILNENVTEASRDFWILADNSLAPSRAIHTVAGVTWENETFVFDVEGFYKDMSNLVEFTQRFRRQALDLYTFLSGNGRVKGIECLLQKKSGFWNGWISYTLSKAEKRYSELNDGQYFPAENDQTHELKIVGNVDLGSDWNVSATFIYATGKPYTAPISQYSLVLLDSSVYSYTHVSGKDAYRLPDYHRLDVSVSKKFRWESSSFNVGVSLFNVYNYTNISYYEYDLNSQPIIITKVTGLGFLPSVFVQYEF